MEFVTGLRCRECGRRYGVEPLFVCEYCFGPLEVAYDYEAIRGKLTTDVVASRSRNMWRYRELLPVDETVTGRHTGFTPLLRADRLAERLGLENLYIKDDSVNHPTLSFKDRVVAVALSAAEHFGFDTAACASTGNLANAVASQAASAGLRCFIFIPASLERSKITATQIYNPTLVTVDGNYDQVNRLCSEIASRYRWAFVNINIRPYYAEGSKTYGFEIAEQLDWRTPDHVVVPCAGGSLITKIWKAFKELELLGLVPDVGTRMHAAQARGCSPIVDAIRENRDIIKPVKPDTIAKSLAIGNPADGVYAVKVVSESGGTGAAVSDEQIVEAIRLLAETEGIFTETAGGVTLAATIELVRRGVISPEESVVVCITGQGLKTQEVLHETLPQPVKIPPTIGDFEKYFGDVLEKRR